MGSISLLDHTSIRVHLSATLVVMVVLILGFFTAYTSRMADSLEVDGMLMEDTSRPDSLIGRIRLLQTENHTHLILALGHDPRDVLLGYHDHPLAFHIDHIQKNIEKITALVSEYEKQTRPILVDPNLLLKFKQAREALVNNGLQPVRDALRIGEFEKANEILLKIAIPLFKAALEAGNRLEAYNLAYPRLKSPQAIWPSSDRG